MHAHSFDFKMRMWPVADWERLYKLTLKKVVEALWGACVCFPGHALQVALQLPG